MKLSITLGSVSVLAVAVAVLGWLASDTWRPEGVSAGSAGLPATGVQSDGMIKDGPFAEITSETEDANHGKVAVGTQLHFADTNGRWRVLVFAATSHMAEIRGYRAIQYPEERLGQGMNMLKDSLSGIPNTELWLIRMDHRTNVENDIMGGSWNSGFNGACMKYRPVNQGPCYTRLIYAAFTPGEDGLYFLPQYQWFRETFKLWPVDEGLLGDHAYDPFYLPYVAILDPHGNVYGWRDTWAGSVPGHESDRAPALSVMCREVLLALNSIRVKEGASSILVSNGAQRLSNQSYIEEVK